MKPPAISFTDAHVHFWDPARFRYAWLADLPALNRPFLPADFAAASRETPPTEMVFVECGADPGQSLAEVDWAIDLARSEPRLKGIVAHAPIERGPDVRTDLEALSRRPLVKGVRRLLQGERDPGFCREPAFVAGVSLLAEFGFTFDLCVRPDQLSPVAELVRRAPGVVFVLDHCGKPDIRSGHLEPWATHLRSLAALPNVVCKLSGLATEARWADWSAEDLRPYLAHALDCFGFRRVLFGGDWPVATLATTCPQWRRTVEELLSNATPDDLEAAFRSNARRIYQLGRT
ncbi:MAG: amidohydrolase family protein [Verrucomicrobiales bacterium]|nr:amidohydrolase family protein [Verrucomicrobiales bacterium]